MFGDMSEDQLKNVIKQMDKNNDGFLDQTEMHQWIEHTHHIHEDVDTQFEVYDTNPEDSLVSLAEYVAVRASFDGNFNQTKTETLFNAADVDNDQKLNKAEFKVFFNNIVVEETMDDFDTNKDGFMSLDEYIGDGTGNWVTTETARFHTKDKNHDGKLDMEELKDLLAHDDDHATDEAKQLIKDADKDPKDQKLSEEEILEKF